LKSTCKPNMDARMLDTLTSYLRTPGDGPAAGHPNLLHSKQIKKRTDIRYIL
jgi:hypothetical protein